MNRKKNREWTATKSSNIIDFLKEYGFSKNKVKTYVRLGYIVVNNQTLKKLPLTVQPGDHIIVAEASSESTKLEIIYEDDNYLVVNKEAGLLTISTSNSTKETEDTLYKRVRFYLNQKHEYAFIVNRIDKETSGLVVFVKNESLKEKLQSNWNHLVKKRGYIAIVSGKITKDGRIDNYLYEDKMTFSHSTKVGGKRAITNYHPLKSNHQYTLLDVWIETGRKNQIRVHFTEMNHPIVGDKKYGSKENPLKRLALHHYELSLIDPLTKQLLTFTSKVPDEFYHLFS